MEHARRRVHSIASLRGAALVALVALSATGALAILPLSPLLARTAGEAAAPAARPAPLRSVGFLLLPGVYNSELMAPYDVFHHVRFHAKEGPRVFTVAPGAGPVTTFEGVRITPDHTFDDAPPIDLLVVPSAEHNMDTDLEDARLIAWVRERGGKAKLLLSLCDGAFILAKAGLLDGLEATTFPGDQDRFAGAFPAVRLMKGVLFVHDGKAVTSVGGARSYDAAMYVVESLYGREAAEAIGKGLVLEWSLPALAFRRAPGAVLP